MSEAVAVAEDEAAVVARPLRVLVPLIKEDLQAAEEAGMPYYQAAGAKLLEAKAQMRHGEFIPWLTLNFALSHKQATLYMRFAEHLESQRLPAGNFSSLGDFMRKAVNPNYNKPHTVRPLPGHDDVKRIIGRVDTETLNLKREELKRDEERAAQQKLALQLIDIGFKVLAKKLHPDKGGSREAMSRLNAVRDRLKQYA